MNKLFIFSAVGSLSLIADQNYQTAHQHSPQVGYNEYYGSLQPYASTDEELNSSGYNEFYGKPQPYVPPKDESTDRRGYNEFYGGQLH